ncbi:MAG: class I SAM-dependent methyltransferase [Solirubrobacteraceae bacterium]
MTRDWDAATYHRVGTPQARWAERVLERLDLRGDETVLDAGCGSGRVTAMLLERLPSGRVIAVDSSPSMVAAAREALPADRVDTMVCNLVDLELAEPVDAVFSNAVFHWILDHDRLFERLHAALRSGGQLVAQCGGEGNIATFKAAMEEVAAREPYADHIAGWTPWNYAAPGVTEARLRRAGFAQARCWRTDEPVEPEDPESFVSTVCLGAHLDRLPDELREPYTADVLEVAGEPLLLEYVRLNIDARA